MLIRTYADIEKLRGEDALSEAERLLIDHFKTGEPTILGDGNLPKEWSADRIIRADILRCLLLERPGNLESKEPGLCITGACILGQLDVSRGVAKGSIVLRNSVFETLINAAQASFDHLDLSGCILRGFNSTYATFRGVLALDDVHSTGEISIGGAKVYGQFSCLRSKIEVASGKALMAQGGNSTCGSVLRSTRGQWHDFFRVV